MRAGQKSHINEDKLHQLGLWALHVQFFIIVFIDPCPVCILHWIYVTLFQERFIIEPITVLLLMTKEFKKVKFLVFLPFLFRVGKGIGSNTRYHTRKKTLWDSGGFCVTRERNVSQISLAWNFTVLPYSAFWCSGVVPSCPKHFRC